ncbi:hypothetical protein OK016_12745 [Vibrio chagasii]|nr:hypothetical protein [Vibrio chagasii]
MVKATILVPFNAQVAHLTDNFISFVSLSGEGWDLESVWAFNQDYRGPKKRYTLESGLTAKKQTKLNERRVFVLQIGRVTLSIRRLESRTSSTGNNGS